MLSALRDAGDIGVELFSRNLYWRVPSLIRWYRGRPVRQEMIRVPHDAWQAAVAEIVKPGQLLLVHASLTGVSLEIGPNLTSGLSTALTVLHDVTMLLGDGGTLAMPTHPQYPEDLITNGAMRRTAFSIIRPFKHHPVSAFSPNCSVAAAASNGVVTRSVRWLASAPGARTF